MAAKLGGEHHKVIQARENKTNFLAFLEGGSSVTQALTMVGVGQESFRKWIKDTAFAAKVEQAKAIGQDILKQRATLGGANGMEFAEFSKEFLGMQVFPHQQDWVDVLESREPSWLHPGMTYEKHNPNRLLINVPPEHAKSTVVTVGYSTYRIALDPNVRIIIVSKTLNKAREFVYSVKQRLSHPRWHKLQSVFGPAGGYKQDADTWKADTVYLGSDSRDSSEKDPTIQALGMGGQIYGARADLIILDDVITTANAHEWPKQIDWLQKEVITRLGKNGKLLVVGTRIAGNDLYRELRNEEHWAGGFSPFTYLSMPAVLEFDDKPKDWVTLWPKSDRPWDGDDDAQPDKNGLYSKWDGPTLYERRGEVTANTWALVYQQQDVEEDSIFPAQCVLGATNGLRKRGDISPGVPGHPTEGNWYKIMGLDPAMTGNTAAVMYAVERITGKRLVLDVYNMKDPTPAKMRNLIEVWVDKYGPGELRVEINAFQKAISLDENLRQWLASRGVKLNEHFTGKNKWDTDFGVAAMAPLFGMVRDGKFQKDNIVELPAQDNEHVKALVNQLITWKPDTKGPTDCVMALWFCEIRAREMIQKNGYKSAFAPNRFATRRSMSQRGTVSLTELAADQYTIYI